MSEERMMILKMLQEGKITAEEAARLLDAVSEKRQDLPGAGIAEEIKRTVEDVVRAIPKETIDDVKDVIRETVREGRETAREVGEWGRELRRWGGRHGWGWGWNWRTHGPFESGHVGTAPFEDARATAATHLIFRNTRGDLHLSHATDGRLHVRATRKAWAPDPGEAQRLADRLPIDIYEEGETVTVEGPGRRPYHERLRVDFDIAVPDALDVELHLVRGDVTAEGLARDLSLMLVKGHVRVEDGARVAIQAVSSDVEVRRSRGDVAVKVIRGDVKVSQASGTVAVSAKRGDIAVRVDTARQLALSAVRGDLSVRAREFAHGGGASLQAVRGDVALYLGPAARCRIEASTVSGDVSSSLPLTDPSRTHRGLSGVLNAADARVQAHVTRGDITLGPLEEDTVAPQAEPA